jgi:L-alanine-DL-glutamate epimerase-like enolase superfamily enzyme
VTTPLELHGGRVALPTGPGLGFEVDHDAVGRAHERHERQGAY